MNHYAELMLEDEYTDFPEKLASVCAEVVHNKTDCVVALNFADIDFNELQTDLLHGASATCYQWDLEEIKCLFWSVWLAMRSKFTAHVVILTPDNVGALCETYFLYCKQASPMHDELALGNDLAYNRCMKSLFCLQWLVCDTIVKTTTYVASAPPENKQRLDSVRDQREHHYKKKRVQGGNNFERFGGRLQRPSF